jgi:hypothetical protein
MSSPCVVLSSPLGPHVSLPYVPRETVHALRARAGLPASWALVCRGAELRDTDVVREGATVSILPRVSSRACRVSTMLQEATVRGGTCETCLRTLCVCTSSRAYKALEARYKALEARVAVLEVRVVRVDQRAGS